MSQELTDEDKALVNKIEEDAYGLQLRYRGCSQTTLKALQDNLGIGNALTIKAANSLCSGICGMGTGPCGSLLGGIMALGLEFGREDFEEPGPPKEGLVPHITEGSSFNRTQVLARELYAKFMESVSGFVRCVDIQENFYAIGTLVSSDPKVLDMKKTGELYSILSKDACKMVALAARLTAEIILRERKKDNSKTV